MNLLDHLFIEDAITNGRYDDALVRSRGALDSVYHRTGTTLAELYGGSNDEAGGAYREDSPFVSRAPRPMLKPTPMSDTGFTGLEAPLG